MASSRFLRSLPVGTSTTLAFVMRRSYFLWRGWAIVVESMPSIRQRERIFFIGEKVLHLGKLTMKIMYVLFVAVIFGGVWVNPLSVWAQHSCADMHSGEYYFYPRNTPQQYHVVVSGDMEKVVNLNKRKGASYYDSSVCKIEWKGESTGERYDVDAPADAYGGKHGVWHYRSGSDPEDTFQRYFADGSSLHLSSGKVEIVV